MKVYKVDHLFAHICEETEFSGVNVFSGSTGK